MKHPYIFFVCPDSPSYLPPDTCQLRASAETVLSWTSINLIAQVFRERQHKPLQINGVEGDLGFRECLESEESRNQFEELEFFFLFIRRHCLSASKVGLPPGWGGGLFNYRRRLRSMAKILIVDDDVGVRHHRSNAQGRGHQSLR